MESSLESAILCHGFEPGVLAGKLCVRDAQVSNTIYIPTPPYVMGLSQASWLVSCASQTHTSPPLSMFPRHIAWEYRHPWVRYGTGTGKPAVISFRFPRVRVRCPVWHTRAIPHPFFAVYGYRRFFSMLIFIRVYLL